MFNKLKQTTVISLTALMIATTPLTQVAAAPTTEATTEQTTQTTEATTQTSQAETTSSSKVSKAATAPTIKMNKEKVVVAVKKATKVKVSGIDEDEVTYRVEDEDVATVDQNGNLVGQKTGETQVVAQVGETEVTADVEITDPKLAENNDVIAKYKTETVAIRSASEDSISTAKVTKGSASVRVTGNQLVVYPKKVGQLTVSVTTDGKTNTYSASVGTQTALNAIAKAKQAKGKKYSQAKRMRKNYYDCSSLIWRVYKPYGVKFGSSSYAPTAAMEAKNMKRKKKVVAYKRVKTKNLVPGDVIFYSYTRNGRYRNISHVALYIGNGRIIHAANSRVGVIEADYVYSKSIKMVARPTK